MFIRFQICLFIHVRHKEDGMQLSSPLSLELVNRHLISTVVVILSHFNGTHMA